MAGSFPNSRPSALNLLSSLPTLPFLDRERSAEARRDARHFDGGQDYASFEKKILPYLKAHS
jgi:hypothetical protein